MLASRSTVKINTTPEKLRYSDAKAVSIGSRPDLAPQKDRSSLSSFFKGFATNKLQHNQTEPLNDVVQYVPKKRLEARTAALRSEDDSEDEDGRGKQSLSMQLADIFNAGPQDSASPKLKKVLRKPTSTERVREEKSLFVVASTSTGNLGNSRQLNSAETVANSTSMKFPKDDSSSIGSLPGIVESIHSASTPKKRNPNIPKMDPRDPISEAHDSDSDDNKSTNFKKSVSANLIDIFNAGPELLANRKVVRTLSPTNKIQVEEIKPHTHSASSEAAKANRKFRLESVAKPAEAADKPSVLESKQQPLRVSSVSSPNTPQRKMIAKSESKKNAVPEDSDSDDDRPKAKAGPSLMDILNAGPEGFNSKGELKKGILKNSSNALPSSSNALSPSSNALASSNNALSPSSNALASSSPTMAATSSTRIPRKPTSTTYSPLVTVSAQPNSIVQSKATVVNSAALDLGHSNDFRHGSTETLNPIEPTPYMSLTPKSTSTPITLPVIAPVIPFDLGNFSGENTKPKPLLVSGKVESSTPSSTKNARKQTAGQSDLNENMHDRKISTMNHAKNEERVCVSTSTNTVATESVSTSTAVPRLDSVETQTVKPGAADCSVQATPANVEFAVQTDPVHFADQITVIATRLSSDSIRDAIIEITNESASIKNADSLTTTLANPSPTKTGSDHSCEDTTSMMEFILAENNKLTLEISALKKEVANEREKCEQMQVLKEAAVIRFEQLARLAHRKLTQKQEKSPLCAENPSPVGDQTIQ